MPEVLIPVPKVAIGQTFRIKGEIKENPLRFDVDFMEAKNNEYYLHIKVDFKAQEVLRNSALEKDAGWGTREVDGGFPFHPSMIFDLTILIEAPHYSITLDGVPFCTFRHRASPLKINTLRIRGDVFVQSVDIEHVRRLSALPMPPAASVTSTPTSDHRPASEPDRKERKTSTVGQATSSTKQESKASTSNKSLPVKAKRLSTTTTDNIFKVEQTSKDATNSSSQMQPAKQASSTIKAAKQDTSKQDTTKRESTVRGSALEATQSGDATKRCCRLV